MYPRMNKVLQASVRVIRSETHKGVVLLIDNGFLQNTYKKLFPEEWNHAITLKSKDAANKHLDQFWNE